MFYDDIREKKVTGRGAFSKRGKGVKHTIRGIKTAYDFMTTKEKKKLNSEVRSFNMYEQIISKEEFFELDRDTQRNMLIKWRDLYQNVEIMKVMGIKGSNTFSNLLKELDIPPKRRVRKSNNSTQRKKAKTTVSITERSPVEEIHDNGIIPVQQNPIKIIINGLHLEYNGIFDAEQLARIFTKLQLVTDGENSDYYLSLTLTEEEVSREKENQKMRDEIRDELREELREEIQGEIQGEIERKIQAEIREIKHAETLGEIREEKKQYA
jgi:hypothetical protein